MRKNVDLLDGTPEMIPGDVYMGVVTKFGNTKKKRCQKNDGIHCRKLKLVHFGHKIDLLREISYDEL